MPSLSVVVPVSAWGGIGSRSGADQTVERIVTQASQADGVIVIDGAAVPLAAALEALATSLESEVGDLIRITGSSSGGPADTVTLQILE